eukprot:gnl/TRDRNA2_/TRDRNA2_177792_c1_seq3.p1 gnl/TRDRNA2_/TRDRNA2_177792_c1~~gnl/TRDRNA2_/TRDRNA2_177792_c1_seq3.p1  ORF type:complete len:653 (-),score=101.96 gnl/TRDRNA2_/TRDRNA2_177792_c1_seq3:78-2036(-)
MVGPGAGPSGRSKLNGDFDARRLENAVWRLWQKERRTNPDAPFPDVLQGSPCDASYLTAESGFLKKVQGAIGERTDFATIRFPRSSDQEYDDLPTFPIRPSFAHFQNDLRPASQCVVFDGCPEDPYHPSTTPIYQTATFVQPSASEFGAYDYTRSGNPTRTALEKHVAMLENATAAFAFASGMAALHTVTRLLKAGDEVICNADIYGGMHRLLTQDLCHSGIDVKFVDTTDIDAVLRAISPKTKLIHTESPSNPRMRITDLRALATAAHKHSVLLSVDSTMMPPVICKPLLLGVDVVIHSATKFFSGHADCTGGFVCVKDAELAKRVAFLQNAEGTALAPFECFLFLRGIKTMFLRLERAQENARQVAQWLVKHPRITDVYYPGPGTCDTRSLAIHNMQSNGSGTVMSLTTGCVAFSRRFTDACRIFKTTVSFGSVNSLVEMPCMMSHASIPSEKRTLPEDLVRLSVGIEDIKDLLHDLHLALEVAAGVQVAERTYDSKFQDLPIVPNPCVASPRGGPQENFVPSLPNLTLEAAACPRVQSCGALTTRAPSKAGSTICSTPPLQSSPLKESDSDDETLARSTPPSFHRDTTPDELKQPLRLVQDLQDLQHNTEDSCIKSDQATSSRSDAVPLLMAALAAGALFMTWRAKKLA